MGVAKELVELGFKSIKPAVKNFMETGLAKTDGKKLVHMLKSDPPKFNEMYATMDTFTKTGNEQVGLGIIKELDKYGDDLEELNTASKVTALRNKAVEPDQSIESTLFGGPDAQPITSDQLTEFGKQIESKGIEAPQGLTNRNEEIATLQRKGLLERGPQNRFEAIFFGSKEFTDEKDVHRIIRRFRSSTLDDIGLGRTDIKKNRPRDRGNTGIRLTREGKLTLGEDQGFYAGTPKGSHAHHWTPLAVLDHVVEGMTPKQTQAFLKYLEKELQIFGGNHIGNLRQLPDNVHIFLHKRLDALGYNPQTLQSFAKATLRDRKAFMKKMKLDFDKLEEEIFREMMIRKGNIAGPQLKPAKPKIK